MVQKSINLLQPEELAPKKAVKTFQIRMGAIFLLVAYCLVVVAIFSFWLVIKRESESLDQQIEVKKTRLKQLQPVESLQFLLKQRLAFLSDIVEVDGVKPKNWLSYLDSQTPDGVALEELIWISGGQITFSGLANNALALTDFLDRLKKETDDQKIGKSTLVSAARQEEGTYSFTIEIQAKK